MNSENIVLENRIVTILGNIKKEIKENAGREYCDIIKKYYSRFLDATDPRETRKVVVKSITHAIDNTIDYILNKVSEDDIERYAPSSYELCELAHNKEFKKYINKVLPNCKMDLDVILDEAYRQYYWDIFDTTSQLVEKLK